MSASEKLRATADAACSQEWPFLITNEESPVDAIIQIRVALPQIVAVVEAAETHYGAMARYYQNDPDEWWPQLRSALAALDEALS